MFCISARRFAAFRRIYKSGPCPALTEAFMRGRNASLNFHLQPGRKPGARLAGASPLHLGMQAYFVGHAMRNISLARPDAADQRQASSRLKCDGCGRNAAY